jgi:hypothetical protein
MMYMQDWTFVVQLDGVSSAGVLLPPIITDKQAVHWMGWHVCVTEVKFAHFPYLPMGCTDNKAGVEYLVPVF